VSELTALTLAEARDGLKKKTFSATELTGAHIGAVEKARALNAYVLETPERAASMAKESDARIAKGEAGPLEGIPLAVKDMFCTAGVRTTACSRILDNFVPTYDSTVTTQLWRDGAVLLGKTNNDEFAMGSANETSYCGPVIKCAADAGRLVRRVGRGGGGAALPGRDRHRHRRLDPPAGGIYGHGRHQADVRPRVALGNRRLRVLARPGRPFRQDRARRRDPDAIDGRP
jgi:Asp-tRNA(Asn)/Glu-tRNA(Gln) amidotransferase A subunit family amidase